MRRNQPSLWRLVLDGLDRHRPTLFVPSHGDVLRSDDVAERLRDATAAA